MKTIAMTVIGAGSFGSALAIALARNGHNVLLWGHNSQHIKRLQEQRCNQVYLPDIQFPENLFLEASLKTAITASDNILIAVPSHVFHQVLYNIQPYLDQYSRVIWATKGLEHGTGRLLQEVAREILGEKVPLAVFSGPTFAKELAIGWPTAMTIAASDVGFGKELQQLFHCDKSFRVYKSSDMIGVQLGGAVKNVIAIGAGISDGMGFGANARIALITRGLAEISRLGGAMGAELSTFMGMTGLGDLVLTCTDNQSRNRRFGIFLGKGMDIKEAEKQIGQVVEGYLNTKEVHMLAQRIGVEMPIVEQIYQILYCGKDITEAANTLLSRTLKDEI
ncbi:NAD(P)H-dependent glycerol-3-phosphate dehydrogenase [Bartonella krasnovii]|uniref:Glycerol-3-phosphate dehydrogenase [NAD(P)+] n=1 Tax=Bartonella krasnovii TaxID=2267275 RepID=A0A5B9CZD3_9HYPH|nr:NAD(P)H-dependent glycerol-3-phosphate dehydrogenase [Bartonella krasnovii]QEE11465.1 NAD(P)H-dependent glycerol-3-phosphate dehydrogenase [Bartonella krasnovii]UNF29221.1 NAD(P)H-dependent glycerol-3-phosphate dehydrogenase [Bartonella krasnovii]UNF35578.1 NAD(P)H-dependent glycerol-3-phosphate dehydrogenase [Bartonella krasnovii]UNF37194.1 NAD(P)H-dependent glycerol-3-phosphate dehydrogenase [Bartonella krasnovii]UNF38893.1 NAD(P)H-dependent glycerol-3-phosphate dehydrogenase [Bartonella 